MDIGYLSDQRFGFFIIFGPLLHGRFEWAGNIEGDGFAFLLPGNEEDGMFRAIVVTSAGFFPAFSGGGDEGAFDPWAEVLQLTEEGLAFGVEL